MKRFHLQVSTKRDRCYKCVVIWRVTNELVSYYWAKAWGFVREVSACQAERCSGNYFIQDTKAAVFIRNDAKGALALWWLILPGWLLYVKILCNTTDAPESNSECFVSSCENALVNFDIVWLFLSPSFFKVYLRNVK